MIDTRHIKIDDYDYNLPEDRIAKYPLKERDLSKILIYNHGKIVDDTFRNLTDYIPSGSLMVFNNTKVIQARMHFRKETGALIEIFLLEPYKPNDYEQIFQSRKECEWICMIGNLKKWKTGILTKTVNVGNIELTLTAERIAETGNSHVVKFTWDNDSLSLSEIIEIVGELPIPPYLNRQTEESDKQTYQTVYSKIQGSVAAPTAGLHFTKNVLSELEKKNISKSELTLHVGAGTFKPVKSEEIDDHEMHTEYISVQRKVIEDLIEHDGVAVAVGTTSVRTLESLYYIGVKLNGNKDLNESQLHVSQWEPYEAVSSITPLEALNNVLDYMLLHNLSVLNSSTQIIIAPGYEYKYVKMLITNFHQPKSTLLLLVSAFVRGDWKTIYAHALNNDYRFLSYGDSSLLIP